MYKKFKHGFYFTCYQNGFGSSLWDKFVGFDMSFGNFGKDKMGLFDFTIQNRNWYLIPTIYMDLGFKYDSYVRFIRFYFLNFWFTLTFLKNRNETQ